MFTIALSDYDGNLLGEPDIEPLARQGIDVVPVKDEHMIPIPPGTSIMMLIGRSATGRKKRGKKKKRTVVREVEGKRVFPAVAVPPPGYTRTLLPDYEKDRNAPFLPFFCYTPMAWKNDELYIAAHKTHSDLRWNPAMYSSLELPVKIGLKKEKHPKNRLLDHLERCALEYNCFTAQNIFYERWEGGIPTSPSCNASCRSCISDRRIPDTPSPQERIKFIPTPQEIAQIAEVHLETPGGIVSFGQGCEGEPLLAGDIITEAVKITRAKTKKGTFNINTNGSLPQVLSRLFEAGMDSARISVNSFIEQRYTKYFNPRNYKFEDVVESIDLAKNMGKFLSINLLYLPGVNDRQEEVDALIQFIERHPVDMIQVRNLNVDPDYYFKSMRSPRGKSLGTAKFINLLEKKFPDVRIGSFSIPLR